MGSLYSNQVRNSFSSNIRHGCSKAQMCLTKILDIITSIPPQELSNTSSLFSKNRGFDIDLNLELCPYLENEESDSLVENSGSSACSVVGQVNDLMVENILESKGEITNLQIENKIDEVGEDNRKEFEAVDEDDNQLNQVKELQFQGSNDCLVLLIEAAELISTHEITEAEAKTSLGVTNESDKRGSKRNKCWGLEDTSPPVVKSKRGRNQVLPYRYRDSVLDPWKRLSRPQRSTNRRSR